MPAFITTTAREIDVEVFRGPLSAESLVAAVAAASSPVQYYDVRIWWEGDRFDRYTVHLLTTYERRQLSEQTARQIVADAEADITRRQQRPRPLVWDWQAAA